MKKVFVCALVIICVFLLVGCGGISEGEVYEKEYRQAYTQILLMPITISDGKTATVIYVPFLISYPDRWCVRIRNREKAEDDYATNTFWITEEVYNSVEVGDWFVFDKDYCSTEEPHTKERQ